ncbi:Endonuclease/exonuclease/phosphatase [Cyathus striatus]|nr:Endonuclease/exonuclease/phosphatase [Cyathus striatus]
MPYDDVEPDEPFIPPPMSESDFGDERPQEATRNAMPMEINVLPKKRSDFSFEWGRGNDPESSTSMRSTAGNNNGKSREDNEPPCLIPTRTYRFRPSKQEWKHVPESIRAQKKPPTSVRIISWNIDAFGQARVARAKAALRHIAADVLGCKNITEEPEPCCILLQEVNRDLIPFLLEHEWIQRHFQICPKTADKWPRLVHFGNVNLVSRSIEIAKSDILHFKSQSPMGRMGVISHVKLRAPDPTPRMVTIRIINTHLESEVAGEYYRPFQLALLRQVLNDGEFSDGGVIAGDFNAIGVSDVHLARSNNLKDAWRRGDNDESGHTWGYQGPDIDKYPSSRLDKILYVPKKGYEVDEPRRIGIGKKEVEGREWVSDHFGLETTLRMIH